MKWLMRRGIAAFERQWNYDASYLHEIIKRWGPRAAISCLDVLKSALAPDRQSEMAEDLAHERATGGCAESLASRRRASGRETSPKRPPAAAAGPGRGHALPADAGTAWRHGLRLGLHCSCGCGGLMALLLVTGVMDLRAMALVAAAITSERLAPAGERVARAIGAGVVGAGLFLTGRAAGLG